MAAPGGQLAFIAHGNGGVLDLQLTKVGPFLRTLFNELQSHSNVRWRVDGGSFDLAVSKGQEHFEYDGDRTKVESLLEYENRLLLQQAR